MIITEKDIIKKVDFSDHAIIFMLINFSLKTIEIKLEGAYFISGSKIEDLEPALLTINNWYAIEIKKYDHIKKEWIILNEETYDLLRDICEFEYSNNFVIRGFGKKTGLWIEYKILSPQIIIHLG